MRGSIRVGLTVAGWGGSVAAIVLAAIFNGLLLPEYQGRLSQVAYSYWATALVYLAIFGVSILAAVVIDDLPLTIGSFFLSYIVAVIVTYTVLVLPAYVGASPASDVLFSAGVVLTFSAFFPVPLFIELVGTLTGAAVAERLS